MCSCVFFDLCLLMLCLFVCVSGFCFVAVDCMWSVYLFSVLMLLVCGLCLCLPLCLLALCQLLSMCFDC